MNMEELSAWAMLVRTPGAHYERIASALQTTASAAALVASSDAALERFGFPESARRRLREMDRTLIEKDLAWLAAGPNRHLLPLNSPRYPALLAQSGGAPAAVYVCGSLEVLGSVQLAIVGSRNPTAGGRDTAREFAGYLAGMGMTITSGLAEGIDAASHEGALSAPGGNTIAVCGTGLDRVYPRSNAALARQIAQQGALVSEFPPDAGALKENFPRRNRIISGLSIGTLVVEAARQSGSLITARLASEQGREVFAIPGSIHNPMSRGCHRLIREGAKLVETAEDILAELQLSLHAAATGVANQGISGPVLGPGAAGALDKEYEILLDALGFDPVQLDAVVERSGLEPAAVASMLLILELRGAIEAHPGGRYCRIRSGEKPDRQH
jgi:DNA processing protein